MCDSPVVCSALSLSDSALKCSNSGVGYCETQLDHVDENLDDNFLEANNYSGKAESCGSSYTNSSAYIYRFQLEQDVQQLQQQLQEEIELHAILENAIEKTAATLFSQSCLPLQVLELLSSIAILESTVSELEEKLISLHFQLSQERNERRLAEYRWRHSSSQSFFICSDIMKEPISSPLGCPKHPISELHHSSGSEDTSFQDQLSEGTSGRSYSTYLTTEISEDTVLRQEKKLSMTTDTKYSQPVDDEKLTIALQPQGLSNHPCKLSEEMVRCMKNIFISLADSTSSSRSSALESHNSSLSPRGDLSNLSTWSLSERSIVPSWVQSPKVDLLGNTDVLVADDTCDPYRVCGKLSWADSGNYGLATEVSWMSVGKEQLEYASTALRRFRTLVEQLAQVNPDHLSSNEKLAFWINLYNALIMHAYLAYGVPRSDLKLFSLMQKAAYTVGGHSFTAAAIEYIILKMKPPVHRPQIALLLALHKLKVSEEQRKFEIDTYEPLVAFALSCGMYSSPAIRIFTAQNINEELEESQRDFIRASVGVSTKGRLLIPKMVHCFAKGFVDDEKLAVWISQYLPPHQAAFVEKCMSQRRQSLFGSRNCGILPFDSRFRYLFLPEKIAQ